MTLRFAHPSFLVWAIPALMVVIVYRWFWHKKAVYHYPMARMLRDHGLVVNRWPERILAGLRLGSFMLLALLLAKPQLVDDRSLVTVEGIDIIVVLDVSGSMQFRDYEDDQRSRIEVAKDEAIRFIEKRNNDAIGLVIFGNDALSRVPLTLDKNLLKQMVKSLELGIINPDGTLLSTALVTAANRLKYSKAKSKIMIVLTDGEPSEGDCDPSIALAIAKKLGIKIYTIGIGSDEERLMQHPFFGVIRAPKINSVLLTRLAQETGRTIFYGPQCGRYACYL